MAITLEIYEDSGIAIGATPKGTNRDQVDNCGWKSTGFQEAFQFVDYPIIRPFDPLLARVSYKKYNFVKISGIYPAATRLRFSFIGDVGGVGSEDDILFTNNVRLYYKWTSVYDTPDDLLLSGTLYDPSTATSFQPMFSSTGPEDATSKLNSMSANTTYYSSYLVTQLYVEPGGWDDYGNIGDMTLQFELDEYELMDF